MAEQKKTEKRGFASLTPERRRELASKGGKASRGTRGKESKVPTATII